MTIRDAAIRVLKESGKPLSIAEITKGIIRAKFHGLPTRYPESVVSKAVRRHTVGVRTDGERGEKHFGLVGRGIYVLLANRPVFETIPRKKKH